MASKSGTLSNAGWAIGSTFGTATSAGTGGKLQAQITPNAGVQEIIGRMIGSGLHMAQQATKGNIEPSAQVAMDAGYDNNFGSLLSQFMGTDTPGSEITPSQADYKHVITFNSTLNNKWGTLAFETSSTTVTEFPSCGVKGVDIKLDKVPGYLDATFDVVANDFLVTGTTNSNASLAAATLRDKEIIGYHFTDTFWLALQSSGALSSGQQYNIVSYQLKLERPQKLVGEIKGSSGNSAPVQDGLFQGTLSLTIKELADNQRFLDWTAESLYKCKLSIQGSQIGTGSNRTFSIYVPSMKLLNEPKYALTSEGVNQCTMDWRILYALSLPTGMTSQYPYFDLLNNLSTAYV